MYACMYVNTMCWTYKNIKKIYFIELFGVTLEAVLKKKTQNNSLNLLIIRMHAKLKIKI